LPIQLLVKYFEKDGDNWQIKDNIRQMVSYREFHLLDPFTSLGTFDVVFCRNVLIYFDKENKRNVLDRARKIISPDGYLILGAAETVLGVTDSFSPMQGHRGLYQPADGAKGAGQGLRMAAAS